MANKVLIKKSSVPGKVPTNLDYGELAINYNDGRIFYNNANTEIGVVEFRSDTPIDNMIFVQKSGTDTNDGSTWGRAFATIEAAITEAWTRNNTTTIIDIGPGIYYTNGHLDVPDNCIIRGVYRSVFLRPETGYEERNVLRLGSGCFVEVIVFEDFRVDSFDNPTEGFAISFRPDAVIIRAPYAHKIAIRTTPTWSGIAPPLDIRNANPLVPRGSGVILADGNVCSPYSVYPNIMTWGATPVSYNGIGYVAKNGGLINAVNAISMWAHIHFMAINGGQILLSACSTQFGDYTMVSKGVRLIPNPTIVSITLSVESASSILVTQQTQTIINNMWSYIVGSGLTTGWTSTDEVYTRRDAATLLQCISWVLLSANEKPMIDFTKGLFDENANSVISSGKKNTVLSSFTYMRNQINNISGMTINAQNIVTALFATLASNITNPQTRSEPSIITAISHTWSVVMAGVALTKVPPAKNQATIQESIIEIDGGIVIASGQDDQGSALFIGGLEINADTGELTGPPFDISVNRIATRTTISRSF